MVHQTQAFDPNAVMKSLSVTSTLRSLALPVSLLVLFLLAIFLRLHFLILRGGLDGDQLNWAIGAYNGELSGAYLRIRDDLLAGQIKPNWPYLPGYPALLAILKLLGQDLRSVRIVQLALDAAAIIPFFYVARHLTRSGALALFAACIYAVSPWWALGASYLLGESLLPALVICVLAGMAWTREHPQNALGWVTLGLFCAMLAFFRSEMILLAGPLVLWAVMVGGAGRRFSTAAIAATAFVAPVLAWCLRNYLVNGHFAFAPSVLWYALWSGLGQIPNDFGYLANDIGASNVLNSHGIGFNTPASEALWKKEYLQAWSEHPSHVLKSILYRINVIRNQCDYDYAPLSALCDVVYRLFKWGTLLAMLGLLWKRRWPEAFIIAGPMLYAAITLGFIYIEPRYIRYAGLTYVLGFTVLLALLADIVSGYSKAFAPPGGSRMLKAATAATGVAAIGVYFAGQLASLNRDERREIASSVGALSKSATADRPDITLQSLPFAPVIPAVSITMGPSGLEVDDRERTLSYLAMAALPASNADALLIRTRIKLVYGNLMMGILSANQQAYLKQQVITGPAGSVQSSEFQSSVEPGSRIILHGRQPTSEGSKFLIESLDISFLCLEGTVTFPLLYLFDRKMPRVSLCNHGASTQ